ncbi:hypothetical protein BDR22DRAFT_299459 [Usnea florida]
MNENAVQGSQMTVRNGTESGVRSSNIMFSCKKCTIGNKVTVEFQDATFTFHAQWLHDARCDDGASRNAATAICQQPISTVQVEEVCLSGQGTSMNLDVAFDYHISSKFPGSWLRVMAPLVGISDNFQPALPEETISKGWLVDGLQISEISYHAILPEVTKIGGDSNHIIREVLDKLLDASLPSIVKIVDLPSPNFEDELNHKNNINTLVLKRLFGSVFVHPRRGSDRTFNISSHSKDAERAVGVADYDTTQLLLRHSDHVFYENPAQVQGFYGLEGKSENTWVSVPSALATMREDFPDLYHHLHDAPMAIGRVVRYYGDPLYPATVDTVITSHPGFSDQVKRVRWHPNLTGALLSAYKEYKEARLAHQRFQEILRRDTHQLKLVLKAGDLYIWDNFRLLHGRERVLEVPRTGVGQTVLELVVHDRYRALHMEALTHYVDEKWLIHMPMRFVRC